jgi:RimJ/RimL family protein N-acetyltransferase
LTAQKQLFWKFIVFDGKTLGSVWLEKENPEDRTATLGIFILDDTYQGKGLGEFIVREVIRTGREFLSIDTVQLSVRESNVRAYHCYLKCGFVETNRFLSKDSIRAIHMELALG